MGNWNNFYIQKMGSSDSVHESVSTWGIWCKSIPFVIARGVKEPAKNDWYDEHGDDEYIPVEGLYMQAYTMKVEFGCKVISAGTGIAAVSDVRAKVTSFLEYLRTSGMMKLYSSYTGIGRQEVRLVEVDDNATWDKSDEGNQFLIFSVTFKVNDPVTDVVLGQGTNSNA